MPKEQPLFASKTAWLRQWPLIFWGVGLLLCGELLFYTYSLAQEGDNVVLLLVGGTVLSLLGLSCIIAIFWYSPQIVASPNGFGLQGIGHTGAWRWSEIAQVTELSMAMRLGQRHACLSIRMKEGNELLLWDSSYKNLHEFRQLLKYFMQGNRGAFTAIHYLPETLSDDQKSRYIQVSTIAWWRGINGILVGLSLGMLLSVIYFTWWLSMPWTAVALLPIPFFASFLTKNHHIGIGEKGLAFWPYLGPKGLAFRGKHLHKVLLLVSYKQAIGIYVMTKDYQLYTFYTQDFSKAQVNAIVQKIQNIGVETVFYDKKSNFGNAVDEKFVLKG